MYGMCIVYIDEIKSKATSLGASEPSAGVMHTALDHSGGVKCVTVPDEVTMQLTGAFASEQVPFKCSWNY
jgi:L-serine/L-threonine ammonia-lyase